MKKDKQISSSNEQTIVGRLSEQ